MSARITCHCGECAKCKRREYMRAWYRRPGNAEAQRQSQVSSRQRRIEAVREYDRLRRRNRDPLKRKAQNDLNHAITAGKIVRGSCEVCGAAKAEGHHDDYSKPLDVRWLCRKHHMEQHRRVAA